MTHRTFTKGVTSNSWQKHLRNTGTAYNIGYMTLTGFGDLWVLLAMTVSSNLIK